jgi:hypothetical protein
MILLQEGVGARSIRKATVPKVKRHWVLGQTVGTNASNTDKVATLTILLCTELVSVRRGVGPCFVMTAEGYFIGHNSNTTSLRLIWSDSVRIA